MDMAELLWDNMKVERWCNTMESASAGPVPTTSRPARREVPDLLSWVQCFGMFAVSWSASTRRRLLNYWPTDVVGEGAGKGYP